MKKDYIKIKIGVKIKHKDNGDPDDLDVINQIATITDIHISQSGRYLIYVKWDNEALNLTNRCLWAWLNPNLWFDLLECPENDIILGEFKKRNEHAEQYL